MKAFMFIMMFCFGNYLYAQNKQGHSPSRVAKEQEINLSDADPRKAMEKACLLEFDGVKWVQVTHCPDLSNLDKLLIKAYIDGYWNNYYEKNKDRIIEYNRLLESEIKRIQKRNLTSKEVQELQQFMKINIAKNSMTLKGNAGIMGKTFISEIQKTGKLMFDILDIYNKYSEQYKKNQSANANP